MQYGRHNPEWQCPSIPQRAPEPENDDRLECCASDLGNGRPEEESVHQGVSAGAKPVDDHGKVWPEFGYDVEGTYMEILACEHSHVRERKGEESMAHPIRNTKQIPKKHLVHD